MDFSALSLENKDPSVKTLKTLLIKFIKGGGGIFPACTRKKLAISAQAQQYHEWEVVIGLLILFRHFSDCFTLQIDSVFKTFDRFFELNQDVKEKYTKDKGTSSNGWDALERERFVIPC